MANGNGSNPPNNSKVIHMVALTVCLSVLVGLITEALIVIFKIPDMGGPVSGGFTHTVDTLVGAVIAMLINTRPQEQRQAETSPTTTLTATPVTITQPADKPVPVTETEPSKTDT